MNKEIKAKWVEALRSGKYKQGHGVLNRDGRYCCLGVLCDVKDSALWKSDGCYSHIPCSHFPPSETLTALELPEEEAWKLVNMNDQSRKSFLEIADYIEANL